MEIVRVKIIVENSDGYLVSSSEIVMPKNLSNVLISKMLFWKKDFTIPLDEAEDYLKDEQEFINGNKSEDVD